MSQPTRRIAIVEEWSVLRKGLASVLHGPHIVVASAEDMSSALAVIEERDTDLLVFGGCRSFDLRVLQAALAARGCGADIMLLREGLTGPELAGLLHAGVRAVLHRNLTDTELLEAIDRMSGGDRVIDQRFLPLLYEADSAARAGTGDVSILTPREVEVLHYLSRGHGNREIAEHLFVGEATIKTHLTHIYAKLEVSNRHQAVRRALEVGLLR